MYALVQVDESEDPLRLEYWFKYDLQRSDYERQFPKVLCFTVPVGIGYAVFPEETDKPARLLITGKQISFEGSVIAYPEESLNGWKAGLVQTIYKAERNAHYQGGLDRKVRLNTPYGPLMDGRSAPFYGPPVEPHNGKFSVYEDDEPNFEMPLKFGPNGADLERTSGEDHFCTFFVLAREQDKSIIELSRVRWRIVWDGTVTKLSITAS